MKGITDERGVTRWPNGAMCDGAVLYDPTEDERNVVTMSKWRVWCIDGDDRRMSAEDTDLIVTWRWADHWTLEAVLPKRKRMLISRDGCLCHFAIAPVERPELFFRAPLDWDKRIRKNDRVNADFLTITVDQPILMLLDEYLPSRPHPSAVNVAPRRE